MKSKQTKEKKNDDFIPPDGGWGWMIVVAAGFSNLAALPTLQQFGLLFRDRFATLGITSSETTTIVNMHSALNSCVGLANGPVFKTFSYRQVSLTGAIIVFISLLCTTFSYNFFTYLMSISILYGAGYGISSSANALALNTYFKDKRRLATGLSWTTTGLGPILWPQIITALFAMFGETGTILILSGFSLHSVACALLLQPVEWHSKHTDPKDQDEEKLLSTNQKSSFIDEKKKDESGYFSQVSKIKNLSLFSSQYLYNEDDPVTPGYEITDPGVPMMVRANDGYFSQSRQSKSKRSSRDGSAKNSTLNSKKTSMSNLLENRSRKSSTLYLNDSKKNSAANLGALAQERETKQSSKPKRKTSITLNAQILESEVEDCPTLKAPQDLKPDEKAVVENIDPERAKLIADRAEKHFVGTKSIKSFKMDGQYGEQYNKDNHSNISFKNPDENEERKYLKDNQSNQSYRTRYRRKSNNFNYESEVLKQASLKLEEYLKESEDKKEVEQFKLIVNGPLNDEVFDNRKNDKNVNEEEDEEEIPLTFCEKVALFFDLDLLKDMTFINLMLGVTLASFNELNFSILTPFILGDFGMSKPQVAFYMSLLAGVDISVRFCVPLIAGKIGWHNNTFFLVGVLSMAFGRVVLAYWQDYTVVLLVAVIVGFGKGLRTVFMALVIPTHVPLHKLPGASGLQLLTAGIVYLALGPLVGWIKDNASTAVTLHCLNIFTYLTAISWGVEKYFISKRLKKEEEHIKFNSEVKSINFIKHKQSDCFHLLLFQFKLIVNGPLNDEVFDNRKNDKNVNEEEDEEEIPLTFCEKVALFFDLDLLKDMTFINLMLGVTLASFNELNFSILTPFILGDFGMSKPQVAFYMSLLAGVDISVRFCVPLIAGKIGWHNNTFFLVGVLSMAFGRVVLAYWQDYTVVLLVAVIVGFGKGLRTVFMALVIPTHVPLHKLPGASGLQLLTAGIVYLALGPLVGWIKDNASTAVTLHCLNIFTYLTAISWGVEKYFISKRLKKEEEHIKV